MSETGKSSDKENKKNDFLKIETQNEHYNSKSVHDEVQSNEKLENRDFDRQLKNGSDLFHTSSSTKTDITEYHGGIQKKSTDLNSNDIRIKDQV